MLNARRRTAFRLVLADPPRNGREIAVQPRSLLNLLQVLALQCRTLTIPTR